MGQPLQAAEHVTLGPLNPLQATVHAWVPHDTEHGPVPQLIFTFLQAWSSLHCTLHSVAPPHSMVAPSQASLAHSTLQIWPVGQVIVASLQAAWVVHIVMHSKPWHTETQPEFAAQVVPHPVIGATPQVVG